MPSSSSRPRMADVAREAGVSTMSVSYTYNQPARVSPATRTKVLAAADRLGYTGPHRAARSLRRGVTGNLGVVIGEKLTYVFDDPGGRRFLAGIAEASLESNAGLVLLPNTGAPEDMDRIGRAEVDGFVVWTTVDDDPVLDVVARSGKPACIQGGPVHEGFSVVGVDDHAAADAVASVALRSAHQDALRAASRVARRESAVVRGVDPAVSSYPVTRHRLSGYRSAVERAGISWSDVPTAVATENVRAEGSRLCRELLSEYDIDVVLAMSDELALGVLDAAADIGSAVPADLSVTGWDDTADASAAGLTTVRQSLFDQGLVAARRVLAAAAFTDPPADDALPAQWSLAIRRSTRP